MQPSSRTMVVPFLVPLALLVAVPGAWAQESCDFTLHGFSADGKAFVVQEECRDSRTATLKIGTLSTGKKVKIASGSDSYSAADVLSHRKVRPLGLTPAGSDPGWTAYVNNRGSVFTFELRKGSARIPLGSRTFKGVKAVVVDKVHWERNLRGVVLRATIHYGVSGEAGGDLIGFRIKNPPAASPVATGHLMIERISSCRTLVRIFRCMVRVTPANARESMQKTTDEAIAKMENALRDNPSTREVFSRSCAKESGKLRDQFRRNAVYGTCMR